MKCNRCKKRISLREWLRNAYCMNGFFRKWEGYCDKCEKIETKNWINLQIKLVKEGKRSIPRVC